MMNAVFGWLPPCARWRLKADPRSGMRRGSRWSDGVVVWRGAGGDLGRGVSCDVEKERVAQVRPDFG